MRPSSHGPQPCSAPWSDCLAVALADVLLEYCPLGTVLAVLRLDRELVVAPGLAGGPVVQGYAMLLQVRQEIVHRFQQAGVVTGDAKLTDMTFTAMFDKPLNEGPGSFHADHGVEIVRQWVLVQAVAVLIDIQVRREDQFVGGVLQLQERVVVLAPEVAAGPEVAFDKQRALAIVLAYRFDPGLGGGWPVFVHAVGHVHDVVGVEPLAILPALGDSLEKVLIGRDGYLLGDDLLFLVACVLVDIEDDAHVVLGSLLEHPVDQRGVILIQLLVQLPLQAFPQDRKANGAYALVLPLLQVIGGGKEVVGLVLAGINAAGERGSADVEAYQVDGLCLRTRAGGYQCDTGERPFRFPGNATYSFHGHASSSVGVSLKVATVSFVLQRSALFSFFHELLA